MRARTSPPRKASAAARERLLIGDLAARAGVTAKAVRYYEAIGLLPAPRRSAAGYRVYDTSIVAELGFIQRGKRLGLSLDEIKDLLDVARTSQSRALRARVVAVLDKKLAHHQQRIAELVAQRNALASRRQLAVHAVAAPACDCHGLAADCPCLPVETIGAAAGG